ncbi:MAG TPA: GDP-mannose 4,6-dehydratase [Candidatus Cloacimonadota bacterium]|nr:GDP-mannose 4,6-dehydratase [Candidatus Cloacimonadota bacterium]
MNVAITGSNGFIGKNLRHEFEKHAQLKIIPIDLTNGIDLAGNIDLYSFPPIDVVVHLAGVSSVADYINNPAELYRINILTTINALELCRKHNSKIIFVSSSYVYGKPKYLPIDERHPLNPNNPYAQSKVLGESLCLSYKRDFGISYTILRLFNIYGPGQKADTVIQSIIDQIQSGKKNIVLNDPLPRRDFVYITDLCNAIINLILNEKDFCEIYNIATGISYSVNEIAKFILEIFNKDISVSYKNLVRPNEILEVTGDYSKIRRDLGWNPVIGIKEGLELIIKYKNNIITS